jgi:hypothetical protein
MLPSLAWVDSYHVTLSGTLVISTYFATAEGIQVRLRMPRDCSPQALLPKLRSAMLSWTVQRLARQISERQLTFST